MNSLVDDEAFEKTVVTHYDTLLKIAYQYTRSRAEAEDIVQDTFLKYLKIGDKRGFADDEHVKAWLIRAAINACKDYLKSARRNRSVSLSEITETDDKAVNDGQTDVMDAIRSLDPKYRDVLYLHYYEGYSIRETAKILGRSENTVSSRIQRGRRKLKEVITDEH